MSTWFDDFESAMDELRSFQIRTGSPLIIAAVNPDDEESSVVTVGTPDGIKEVLWQIQRTVVKRLEPKENPNA